MSEPATQVGFRLIVRVTPKGARDAPEGLIPDASGKPILKARVAAAAEGGKANGSLVALLAKEFRVPKNAVTIVRGAGARVKQVRIEGDGTRLAVRLHTIGEGA